MEAVGYDLYCKLLNQAVKALKGQHSQEQEFETVVECDIDAYIPSGYIKNEYQKLDVYKRISGIENNEEYMDMQDELMDRFGEIPKPVENLLQVAALKALGHRAYVTEMKVNCQEVRLSMYPKARLDTSGIPELIARYKGELKFQMADQPCFFYIDKKNRNKDCMKMLSQAKELLESIEALAESHTE